MSNPYFKFKEFIIYHDRCAMKVCTDACILGAWLAERIGGKKFLLDIGSGSGLLMMMLAQRSDSVIHGIEIDREAYAQSLENIQQRNNPDGNDKYSAGNMFNNGRLQVFKGDVRSFSLPLKYDFIITNPPFYSNDLKAEKEEDNIAKHSSALGLEALIDAIDHHLTNDGSFGLLLPVHRVNEFEKLAASRFRLKEKMLIRQTPNHNHFRAILYFERRNKNIPADAAELFPEDEQLKNFIPPLEAYTPMLYDLCIKDENGNYSRDFTVLLRDYYLK
ncbi:MAG: methyltransferase [Flavitalea sp.]